MNEVTYYQILKFLNFELTQTTNLYQIFEKNKQQILLYSNESKENQIQAFYLNELKQISKQMINFLFNNNLGKIKISEEENEIKKIENISLVLEPIKEEEVIKYYYSLIPVKKELDQETNLEFLKKEKYENVFYKKKGNKIVFPLYHQKNVSNFLYYDLNKNEEKLQYKKINEFYISEFKKKSIQVNIHFSLDSIIQFENSQDENNEYPTILITENFTKVFVFQLLGYLINRHELLNQYKIFTPKTLKEKIKTLKFFCYFSEFFHDKQKIDFTELENKIEIHFSVSKENNLLELTTFATKLNKELVNKLSEEKEIDKKESNKYFFSFTNISLNETKIFTITFFKNDLYLRIIIKEIEDYLKIPNLIIKN